MSKLDNTIVQDAVKCIVSLINPFKVIVIGSYARGDARPDSDLDLLVVADIGEGRQNWEKRTEIRSALKKHRCSY